VLTNVVWNEEREQLAGWGKGVVKPAMGAAAAGDEVKKDDVVGVGVESAIFGVVSSAVRLLRRK